MGVFQTWGFTGYMLGNLVLKAAQTAVVEKYQTLRSLGSAFQVSRLFGAGILSFRVFRGMQICLVLAVIGRGDELRMDRDYRGYIGLHRSRRGYRRVM